MKLRFNKKIILPLTILLVIFASILIPAKLSQSELQQSKSNQNQLEEIKSENPTPENIQVLDTNDTIKTQQSEFDVQVLYNLINSYRKENGLTKLFINIQLEDSAKRKLDDMITKDYFRHADTTNNESWYLFQAAGYQYKSAGENLSTGHNTPWQVFSAWQNSEQHNQQLLKPEYLDMGLAVNCQVYEVRYKPSCIVVLHLGVR
jgi:uncharacterized protein YkwD